uniref:Alpha-ketoglutarate-dependent dioxygenase AlkB-like domain-containing protein n=1 Tax=Chromera velia CCMP2878 TaxID=1169474 RepID=A0A0G4I7L4_9ALVE|eukprot:Cvel_11701.t1-p1 / transcript=Cvel_11701.t1 / gene=Cvel_11701 / organism=Chromera_velia_CCMP2878 / gene_product=Uncharacterized protein R156, putative / transcript_product=Uncharacterized protein R156, putative / location=Cvel_scaffold742:41338-42156(-) / protein_length=273 / sequence_SO=supercontig / SO=protein_coding / is_pseudo=false
MIWLHKREEKTQEAPKPPTTTHQSRTKRWRPVQKPTEASAPSSSSSSSTTTTQQFETAATATARPPRPVPRAGVLVLRNFINLVAPGVTQEQFGLTPDKQYYDSKTGTVKKKRARYNLCFEAGDGRPANMEAGQGTVVGFNQVPHTHKVQKFIVALLAAAGVPKEVVSASTLRVETNVYTDPSRNGIGFHGDTERRVVVGVRLGLSKEARMPIVFRWYQGREVMKEYEDRVIDLGPGDVYFMSEKAAGSDWKNPTIPTLRHAAGAPKYTQGGR